MGATLVSVLLMDNSLDLQKISLAHAQCKSIFGSCVAVKLLEILVQGPQLLKFESHPCIYIKASTLLSVFTKEWSIGRIS